MLEDPLAPTIKCFNITFEADWSQMQVNVTWAALAVRPDGNTRKTNE